jgi:hypothetical protein
MGDRQWAMEPKGMLSAGRGDNSKFKPLRLQLPLKFKAQKLKRLSSLLDRRFPQKIQVLPLLVHR